MKEKEGHSQEEDHIKKNNEEWKNFLKVGSANKDISLTGA